MDDGIGITGLTIGGTALTAIGGILGAWLRSRHNTRRIEPQPFEVRGAPEYATKKDNDEAHKNISSHLSEHKGENEKAHENIFSRLSEHDKKIAKLEEQGRNATRWMESIDRKLDTLLMRTSK